MNQTNPINKSQNGKKNKFGAAAGAAGAAAAGIGGAAIGYAANGKEEPRPQEHTEPQDAATETSQPQQPQQSATASQQPQQSATASQQPQASSEEFVSGSDDDIVIGLDGPETETEYIEVTPVDENETTTSETEQIIEEPEQESVNPDEIAEAIISEEMVDPNDIDMADVVSFEEIGTVYNVYGEAMTTASFHDEYGNQLTMIDIDNDDVFDVLGDEHGNPYVDEHGDFVAVNTGTTVDDVELEIHDDDTYLAADDNNLDEFGADSLAQDMLG